MNAAERRLLVDRDDRANPDRTLQLWRDRLTTTLTIDALSDSLATLVDQNAPTSTTMTPLGYNPMHDYRVYIQRDGSYGLFAQKDAMYESQYAHYEPRNFSDTSRFASFRYLESIIREAKSHHIQLIMYIHPYHANFLEILRKDGLWSSFEAWKRALVRVVDSEQSDSAPPMRLLDFSGYNEVTTERVPAPGDVQSQMRWYWESGHYKRELGDLVLSAMFSASAEFGLPLTLSTIDAVLTKIRGERERFLLEIRSQAGTQ